MYCEIPRERPITRQGQGRVLSIPSPLDRALQRLVLEQLGPALDKLFENSSLAWRRGLGRERAPHRVLKAWQDGFRFALREDFDRFFDSIDHQELADRLSAYVTDARLVAQILAWARSGAPAPPPTGAAFPPAPRCRRCWAICSWTGSTSRSRPKASTALSTAHRCRTSTNASPTSWRSACSTGPAKDSTALIFNKATVCGACAAGLTLHVQSRRAKGVSHIARRRQSRSRVTRKVRRTILSPPER
jgi:hypothetical protein